MYIYTALGTQPADVAVLADKLAETIPVLSATLRLRHNFREEVLQYPALTYIEDLSWAGLGAVRSESTPKSSYQNQHRLCPKH